MAIISFGDLRRNELTLSYNFRHYPVTYCMCGFLVLMHMVYMQAPQLIFRWLYFSYEPSVYNLMISDFLHLNVVHLIMNVAALYNYKYLETKLGRRQYVYTLIYFAVMNACVMQWFHQRMEMNFSIGYSGVLFGLMTLYPPNMVFGHYVEEGYRKFVPFMMLVVMQLLVKNVSFFGHLAGIVSAYLWMGAVDVEKSLRRSK
jgi:membrane associated rhomboid family serine protease